jgi:hemolysin-activating ACP:hemolysin acyltransferase
MAKIVHNYESREKPMAKKGQDTKLNGAAKAGNGAAKAETPQGSAATNDGAATPALDPAIVEKIAAVRSHVRESFGKVVMAMMMLPRYRHQSLADLQHLVLEPLIRDRVAIAYPGNAGDEKLADITGVAIWANVSEEVDAAIREQIKAGTFPLKLKAEDWTSGDINWLIDVIAPNQRATTSVIANFKQVVKDGSLRLHPIITRLVDPDTLTKMGAEPMAAAAMPDANAPASNTVN